MRPASPVYSTTWSPGHPSVPPPPPAMIPALGQSPRRYYSYGEWLQMNGHGLGDLVVGLGQTSTQQIVLSSPSIAGATLTGVAVASKWATWAVPVIGAVVGGVTLGLMAVFARKGPRQKRATTEIVEKIEPLLVENLQGYLAGPHNVSSQQQALANFDAGWQFVVEHCDIPEMGDAGQRCVSERQRGGVAPWCDTPDGRGCDWFTRYRAPIANDPNVRPDPVVDSFTGGLVDSLTGGAFSVGPGSGTLLLGLALLAGAFMLGGGK